MAPLLLVWLTRLPQLCSILLVCGLTACAVPLTQTESDGTQKPLLTPAYAIMADGYRLPVSEWLPDDKPQAVVLALHGFNDYRKSFIDPAGFLAENRIATYAYDQRGFGETQQRGIWPGSDTLRRDAITMTRLLCEKYPDLPLYVLGESMGGAVLMDMMHADESSCVTGVILAAPAVWGWQTMPAWQGSSLWVLAHIVPGYSPTGSGLGVVASDNNEMLYQKWLDPLVIKKTRIDSIYGLTNLMEAALLASSDINRPALILYGERDEIIPPHATCQMLASLPLMPPPESRLVLYPDGYHMLTRDLQADVVFRDMLAWIQDQSARLPSGQEVALHSQRVKSLCSG